MRVLVAALAVVVLVCLGSCSEEPASQGSAPSASSSPSSTLPQSDEPVELDPTEFTADVTNQWFRLEPGTRWTYRETTEDGEIVCASWSPPPT